MKPNKGKYIKHVELIPESEFKKLGVFQSMICQFKEHSDVKGHDINMQLVLSGDDGELKTMGIDDIVCRKEDFIDAFSDGRTLVAVKILWSDGTWEYGLKLWQHAERVYRRNCKLKPMFAKVGVINEETSEVDDVFNHDKECRVPAWILQLIPMYNERIRDAVRITEDKSIGSKMASFEDWKKVDDVMRSNYVSFNAHWDVLPVGKKNTKMAISVAFDKNRWWTPVMTTWKDTVCKQEFGQIADMLEKDAMKVFCYNYIKSIYCDNYKSVKEYKVIPMSNVLLLQRRNWSSESNEYIVEEVWNSLDETCKGNV